MAKDIKKALNIEPELIRSGGGVFEVTKNEKLIFSKKATGRFPSSEEILAKLQ